MGEQYIRVILSSKLITHMKRNENETKMKRNKTKRNKQYKQNNNGWKKKK